MNKDFLERLENCRKKLRANSLKKGVDWNGFEVYEPVYNGEYIGGFPRIILVSTEDVRVATHEETFKYINYLKTKGC